MSTSLCPICKVQQSDMRHLTVECFYDVREVVPEMKLLVKYPGYSIDCCKDCRGDFLTVLKKWAQGEFRKPKNSEANIPVRSEGRTVMMTAEEYKDWTDKNISG